MENNESTIANLTQSGTLGLKELQTMLGATATNLVTIEDWGITFNTSTGQLSEYCTVSSNDSGNMITGIGLLAYSSNGSVLYAAQYTNGISSAVVAPSIGTTLYNQGMGNQALCVVYGWTDQGSFYQASQMTIGTEA